MLRGSAPHVSLAFETWNKSMLIIAGQEARPQVKKRRLSGGEAAASAVQQSLDAWTTARSTALRSRSDAPGFYHPSALGGIDGSTLVGRAVEGTIESCTPAGYMVELRIGMHVMRGALVCACVPRQTRTTVLTLMKAGLGGSYQCRQPWAVRA